MKKSKIFLAILLAGVMTLGLLGGCSAETKSAGAVSSNYPTKDITCIVPYAAGGGTDNIARAVASTIDLPVSIACTVMEGASGMIGSQEMTTKPNDGYYIMSQSPLDLICYYLSGASKEKLWEKLTPLCCMVIDPGILVTSPDSGIKSIDDLKAMDPSKVTWGFIGTREQLTAIQVTQGFGMGDVTLVPYSNGSDAVTAVMGNHVTVCNMQVGDLGSAVKSGNVVPLCIIDDQRCSAYPDLPCTAELGVEAVGAQYRGFFVPAGTDQKIVDYLSGKMEDLQTNEEFLEQCKGFSFIPGYISSEDLKGKIGEWYDTFAPLYEEYCK